MDLIGFSPEPVFTAIGVLAQAAADDDMNWPVAIVAVFAMLLVMTIAIAIIWQLGSSWRARMSIAREEAYRKLAEENLAAQTRLGVQQERISDDLGDLKSRVVEIERLLKEVG